MDKKIDRQTKAMDNLVYGKKLRYKKGEWNILGILHGGEEGKQWQAGKHLVRKAHAENKSPDRQNGGNLIMACIKCGHRSVQSGLCVMCKNKIANKNKDYGKIKKTCNKKGYKLR